MNLPLGTIINVIAVLVGSAIGIIFKKAIPAKYKNIIFEANGLVALAIGIQAAIAVQQPLTVIFSLMIGALIGEALKIEDRVEKIADKIKIGKGKDGEKFTHGLTTSFLIFCIGTMTLVGTISEGVKGNRDLLTTKSILDGFTAIPLAATYGLGVMFSAVPMLIYQSSLTIFAGFFPNIFNEFVISQLSGVGGILIIAIGLNLLKLKDIKVLNLTPSLVIILLLSLIK